MTGTRVHIPDEVASLAPYVDAGALSAIEVHLAAWVARASGNHHPHVVLATAMAAWSARHGHVCASLDVVGEAVARNLAERSDAAGVDITGAPDGEVAPVLDWPEPLLWVQSLTAASGVVRVVDRHDRVPVLDACPLVLRGRRVYLQRHWIDECIVAASMRERATAADPEVAAHATAALQHLLPASVDGRVDLQRSAAEVALHHRLALVVGGPGTGKTYTVARLLAVLLQQQRPGVAPLRVALAAPTGKAAARLQESVALALAQPDVVEHVAPAVREQLAAVVPTTIHRLLGPLPEQRQRFRHHRGNPLPHDVVVVDETSMVSLPLLSRLLEAVHPDARLVLIGDPDQLESVELGAVLGDLVAAAGSPPLAGHVVRLLRGHRFGGDSPIALLADAVRDGDADAAVECLRRGAAGDAAGSTLRFVDTDDPSLPTAVLAVHDVVQPVLARLRVAAEAGDASAALRVVGEARILCAHRHGRFGVSAWNDLGERWLTGRVTAEGSLGNWYAGRPLLVTRNDPRLGLSNGDTGVVVREGDGLVAVFAAAGGSLRFDPAQLEGIETAYAITVHKSQGSEYPAVVLVLPPERSPLVGRELVYTGATRAERHLLVVGSEASVRRSVDTPARRMTGLADALGSQPE